MVARLAPLGGIIGLLTAAGHSSCSGGRSGDDFACDDFFRLFPLGVRAHVRTDLSQLAGRQRSDHRWDPRARPPVCRQRGNAQIARTQGLSTLAANAAIKRIHDAIAAKQKAASAASAVLSALSGTHKVDKTV